MPANGRWRLSDIGQELLGEFHSLSKRMYFYWGRIQALRVFKKIYLEVINQLINCDEKSQCQALERTQRGLPLKKGYSRTQTHDYIRHGTYLWRASGLEILEILPGAYQVPKPISRRFSLLDSNQALGLPLFRTYLPGDVTSPIVPEVTFPCLNGN
jgi:hypothetical protein